MSEASVIALAASGVSVMVYGLLRYFAVGFSTGYSESMTFGYLILKNIILFSGMTCAPWFSDVPVRILIPAFALLLWYVSGNWRVRMLIAVMTAFLLLPVSNLSPRPDYAVAGVPAIALAIGLIVEKYEKGKYLLPSLIIFFAGMFLNSRDEVRTIADASDYVDRTTARLAEIADELPGNGPLFVSGVDNAVGVYGTFWPGEYMLPMECLGFQPGRFVTGTDRIWEALITESDSGFLVFMADNGIHYTSAHVSADMYPELPDTTVQLTGSIPLGNLIRYPSCFGSDESVPLYLVSPIYPDSVITVFPGLGDGTIFYDLAAVPIWLTADEAAVVMVENSVELVFSSRNLSLERALDILAFKEDRRGI